VSPIFLGMPAHKPSGPDGKGWNRLSIGSLAGDECALRPTDYPTMIEARDTRRARYGGFGPCIRQPGVDTCQGCPIYAERTRPQELAAFTDRVLVRIWPPDGQPRLMNHPEKGWSSFAYRWSWSDLARLVGWEIGRLEHDGTSQCFWLTRVTAKPDPPEPVWKGMTADEQRAYVRDLNLLDAERLRARGESRKVTFTRPVYTGSYPQRWEEP
jgi:hypothetical protein